MANQRPLHDLAEAALIDGKPQPGHLYLCVSIRLPHANQPTPELIDLNALSVGDASRLLAAITPPGGTP